MRYHFRKDRRISGVGREFRLLLSFDARSDVSIYFLLSFFDKSESLDITE